MPDKQTPAKVRIQAYVPYAQKQELIAWARRHDLSVSDAAALGMPALIQYLQGLDLIEVNP